MPLNVAVQMDPIERINIRGDSTFALLLEAQARGHSLFYYTPDQLVMRDGNVSASVQPLAVRDKAGDHYTLGEARMVELSSLDVVLQDCLTEYQNPIAPEVMEFQIQIAANEASALEFVPQIFRRKPSS